MYKKRNMTESIPIINVIKSWLFFVNNFNFKKFSRKDRLAYALIYGEFCKYITDNKINVILSTVSLFHKVRKWNRSNINNYIEIYIQSDINTIIKQKRKFFYKSFCYWIIIIICL